MSGYPDEQAIAADNGSSQKGSYMNDRLWVALAIAVSLNGCGGGDEAEICSTDSASALRETVSAASSDHTSHTVLAAAQASLAEASTDSSQLKAIAEASDGSVRWSSARSGLPKTAADLKGVKEVVIPRGTTVILDMSPPDLPALKIQGTLIFEDRRNVALNADSILLTGRLEVGSVAAPFTHEATITLTGQRTSKDDSVDNDGVSRGFNIVGGVLKLYGQFDGPTWTQLNQHLPKGDLTARLVDSVSWRKGDQLIVAPTDFYQQSVTEEVTLARNASGNDIRLSSGLKSSRWGVLQYVTDQGMKLQPQASFKPPAKPFPTVLDERAEVGNLSRRIVIQGADDRDWKRYGFGAHMLIMGLDSKVVIDGVEFRRVGQAGKLARYPLHWHLLSYDTTTGKQRGDATGHVIRNSSIWDSAQRCIVIHSTNGVQVRNNICYDIKGHAIFLEDATERRNVIQGNLVLKVRAPETNDLLKIHEGTTIYKAGSSGIWMTNPDNTLLNNHSGDAQGNGFWFAFPERTLGLSRKVALYPRFIQLKQVEGNVSHSTGGPGQLMDLIPQDDSTDRPEATQGTISSAVYNPMRNDKPCYDSSCPKQTTFTVKGSTIYKTGATGDTGAYRNHTGRPNYVEWVTADNVGTHFAGAVLDGIIQRVLLVGHSLNIGKGYPSKTTPPVGLATYHSSVDMKDNVLVNFPFKKDAPSGAFMMDDYYIRPIEKGTIRNSNNLLISSHPGFRTLPPMLRATHNRAENWALAGAVWDPYGYWGPKRSYVVYNIPFLTSGRSCVAIDGSTVGDGMNGSSCQGPYYGISTFQTDVDTARYTFAAAVHVERQASTGETIGQWNIEDGYDKWKDSAGNQQSCDFHNPPPVGTYCSWMLGWMRHFAAVPGGRYVMEFPTHARTPRFVTFDIENAYRSSDSFLIAIPFDARFTAAGYVIAGQRYGREGPLLNAANYPNSTDATPTATRYFVQAGSLAEVLADRSGKLIWQDRGNNRVWIRYAGSVYSERGQAQQEARSDAGLNYPLSILVYPQGACAGASSLDACLSTIQGM